MPQNWHAIDGQSCLQELQCGEAGLSTAEASRRLAATGPNRLELAAGRSNLLILWDQLQLRLGLLDQRVLRDQLVL